MNALLETALNYRAAGLDVIPDHPKAKYPIGFNSWQTHAFSDSELQQKIGREGWGIGVRTEALEVIDFDNKGNPGADELLTGWKDLVNIQAPGLVDRLVIERTQSGGYHVAYKCSEIGRNDKLARRPATPEELTLKADEKVKGLIETRGKGGQAMVAPSPGYTLLQGDWCNLSAITPEERRILLDTARLFDKLAKSEVTPPPSLNGSARPGDVYNEQHGHEALSLLTSRGWKEAFERNGAKYLTRPGKNNGISATFGYVGPNKLYVFSTSTEFEPERVYSPFAIYTQLEHSGDWRESAKTLARRLGLNGANERQDKKAGDTQWLDTQTVLNALGRAETGDSELLAKLYTGKLAYDHAERQWYLFNGHHWQADERKQVGNLIANEVAAEYLQAAAEIRRTAGDDEKTQEKIENLYKRAVSLRFMNKINNVLSRAASHSDLALSGREWEQSPMLLAVANGVVDLVTGDFRTGQPGDYIRTAAPVAWAGIDTPAPRWEQFLSEIFTGDSSLIAFVQRLLGYAITGQVTEHILPILWGQGRNGKETLLETIKYVLGELAAPASKDVVLESRFADPGRATPHLYALRPLRLAWVSESRAGAKLNSEQIKWLTGGGTITARKLHGDPVTFTPRYTLFLMTNHKPKADADDYALWKRLLLIPFTQSFVDVPFLEHEHQADPRLAEKLKAEGPGILAWLVRGCLTWQKEGLKPPPVVTGATEAYRENEVLPAEIAQFIEDCCTTGPDKQATGGALFKQYERYIKSLNLTPVSTVTFGKMLKKRFRVIGTNPVVIYGGIGLLTEDE